MTSPDKDALERLLHCAQAAQRARKIVIWCLVVLILGLAGVLGTQIYTAHQATVRYQVATARYNEAATERHELRDQLADALLLLKATRRACH